MFVKVFLVVILMIIWVGSAGSGMKMSSGAEDVSAATMGTMLDKKIVEYYLSHSNTLPEADGGCVSLSALETMGLDNYGDYRNREKFNYIPDGNSTFTLNVTTDDGKTFATKNSGKVLSKASKEEF